MNSTQSESQLHPDEIIIACKDYHPSSSPFHLKWKVNNGSAVRSGELIAQITVGHDGDGSVDDNNNKKKSIQPIIRPMKRKWKAKKGPLTSSVTSTTVKSQEGVQASMKKNFLKDFLRKKENSDSKHRMSPSTILKADDMIKQQENRKRDSISIRAKANGLISIFDRPEARSSSDELIVWVCGKIQPCLHPEVIGGLCAVCGSIVNQVNTPYQSQPDEAMSERETICNMDIDEIMTTKEANSLQKKKLRLVVISDTHGHHDKLLMPEGDILLHCGDFSNRGSLQEAQNFVNWISRQSQYSEKFVIGGNHDRDFNTPKPYMNFSHLFSRADPSVRYLHDEMAVSHHGMSIFGASWISCEKGDLSAIASLSQDQPVDVLLAHINPYMPKSIIKQVGPKAFHGWRGSNEVSRAAADYQIPLCLSGHTHYGRGVVNVYDTRSSNVQRFSTTFVNAASLWPGCKGTDKTGVGVFRPVIIDFNLETRKVDYVELTK